MGLELVPVGAAMSSDEVLGRLRREFSIVRVDPDGGLEMARGIARRMKRMLPNFVGNDAYQGLVSQVSLLEGLKSGDAFLVMFGDAEGRLLNLNLIPSIVARFESEVYERGGWEKVLIDRCARVLECRLEVY